MILAIVGPTGVGKTKLSEELAVHYNAIVINCDAVQVYKDLNIGSAKPKKHELLTDEHFLFDFVDITNNYTVFDYQKDLRRLLDKHKCRNIIIVGGTGLYLAAGLYDYKFNKSENNIDYEKYSDKELYDLVLKVDSSTKIHMNNRQRMISFLKNGNVITEKPKLLYDAYFIGLTSDRENIYNRINKRVDEMFEEGLLEEVQALYKYKSVSKILTSAIGYKEVISYLDNTISLEFAKELIKKNSRHYAKRQYTWFNNKMNINWFEVDYDNFNNTIEEVKSKIKEELN